MIIEEKLYGFEENYLPPPAPRPYFVEISAENKSFFGLSKIEI